MNISKLTSSIYSSIYENRHTIANMVVDLALKTLAVQVGSAFSGLDASVVSQQLDAEKKLHELFA